MVDQGVIDGNSLGDMFLHSGDQLTWDFFQLAFRQEAEKEENWENIKDVVVLFDYFYYLSTTTMPSLLKVSRWSLVRKEPILEQKTTHNWSPPQLLDPLLMIALWGAVVQDGLWGGSRKDICSKKCRQARCHNCSKLSEQEKL